ncbi:MAG: hypothetical protein ACRCTP_03600 [Aeromonas popoffii]|uniref:hypothetical protein n=1 Tax=Aeromonas popoffii TaxID=70856 RepID=UPI003F3ABE98
MSVKLSQLEQTVLPIIRGLKSLEVPFSRKSFLATEIFREIQGRAKANSSNKIFIVEVSQVGADLIFKDANAETFSFNLLFDDQCVGLACYSHVNLGQFSSERPPVQVVSGKTPGFIVYTFQGNPIAAFLMYGSNLNNWAGRIGLYRSMHRRTEHPSSHYVRREWAEESGLLWISPVAKQGGKVV